MAEQAVPAGINLRLMNDDWPKAGTWDIFALSGDPPHNVLVRHLPEMIRAFHLTERSHSAQKRWFKHFLTLPASIPMPESLRREITAEYGL